MSKVETESYKKLKTHPDFFNLHSCVNHKFSAVYFMSHETAQSQLVYFAGTVVFSLVSGTEKFSMFAGLSDAD